MRSENRAAERKDRDGTNWRGKDDREREGGHQESRWREGGERDERKWAEHVGV